MSEVLTMVDTRWLQTSAEGISYLCRISEEYISTSAEAPQKQLGALQKLCRSTFTSTRSSAEALQKDFHLHYLVTTVRYGVSKVQLSTNNNYMYYANFKIK